MIEEALILLWHHISQESVGGKNVALQARLIAQFHFISYLNNSKLLLLENICCRKIELAPLTALFIFSKRQLSSKQKREEIALVDGQVIE